MKLAIAGISFLLGGCNSSFVAVEPIDAEIRIVAVFDGEQSSVVALSRNEPFRYEPQPSLPNDVEIWVFGYSETELTSAYPQLAGPDLIANLSPSFSEGAAPPPSSMVLRTNLNESSPSNVAYASSTWAEWTATNRPRFAFDASLAEGKRPCEQIVVTHLSGDMERGFVRVALAGGVPYIVGPSEFGRREEATELARIDGDTVSFFPIDPSRRGRPTSLAFDGEGLTFVSPFGPQRSNPIRRYALDGAALPAPPPPFGNFERMMATQSGDVFFYGPDGLFEQVDSSTITRRTDYSGTPQWGVAPRRDRIVLADDSVIQYFDGQAWLTFGINDAVEVSRVGGDDDVLAVVGGQELVFVYDEAMRTWNRLPRPFDLGIALRAVGAVGEGDFVVAGRSGSMAAWMDGRWCPLDTGVQVDFRDAVGHAASKTAWVVGDQIRPAFPGDPVNAFSVRFPAK